MKRKNGVNDHYICKLIREDSVEDFISYVNKNNILLDGQIPCSIFETSQLLLLKNPSLIEYSIFYGSIQISKYLAMNKVKLLSSLWIYAIHSNNPEILQFLEENQVESFFEECIEESIKCHNDSFTEYFLNNCSNEVGNLKNYLASMLKYCNFKFIQPDLFNSSSLYHLVRLNYVKLIEFLLNKDIDVNMLFDDILKNQMI